MSPTARLLAISSVMVFLAACNGKEEVDTTPKPPWTVSATSNSGGSVSPASQTIGNGKTTAVTVTPNSGYAVSTINGCGGTLNGDVYTTGAITESCVIAVSFVRAYEVSTNVSGNGSISPTGVLVNSGDYAIFTLTPEDDAATPAPEYGIKSVDGCNGTLKGNVYTTGLISTACAVTAVFDVNFAVDVVAGAGGTAEVADDYVVNGDTTTLTITPDDGFVVDSVTGCGVTSINGELTTEAVTADCTMNVSFRPQIALVANGDHTCSLFDDEGAIANKCWGDNASGQLGAGYGNFSPRGDEAGESPANLLQIQLIKSNLSILGIGLGVAHSCSILSDFNLYCWGENGNGELGIGPSIDLKTMNKAVDLDGLAVVEVVGGSNFSCARMGDSSVRCWGDNSQGQLGDGSNTATSIPALATTLADAPLQLAAGSQHACARLANNTVQCWGDNASGQLGDNDGGNDHNTPQNVALGGASVTDIAAGGLTTCVVVDATVKCWGENGSGQLGNGDGTNTDLDVPSAALNFGAEVPVDVEVGGSHACALMASGKVFCWGESSSGQTGQNGTLILIAPAEVDFGAAYTATRIALGSNHSCALLKPTDASDTSTPIRCWGKNDLGQLGLENIDNIGDDETVDNAAFNLTI